MLRSWRSVKYTSLVLWGMLILFVLQYNTGGNRGQELHREYLDIKHKIDQMVKYPDGDIRQKEQTPLRNPMRISCWVMTSPQNLDKKARYIQRTWVKRCDRVVFISSTTNTSFPTVGVNASEGRGHLTEKTLRGFYWVAHHHLEDCDWFVKADDDTYFIMENLRHFLENKDPNEPVYYGHHFKTLIEQGYSSGGSGMVVSKESMRRFAKKGLDPDTCRQTSSAGDAAFGQCMQSLGVRIGNSTDSMGRSRFHCLAPNDHLAGSYPKWYYKYDANGAKSGFDGMSDFPISFHYVAGTKMLAIEYFLYHAKVHSHDGIIHA